jgi:hypothetical protein
VDSRRAVPNQVRLSRAQAVELRTPGFDRFLFNLGTEFQKKLPAALSNNAQETARAVEVFAVPPNELDIVGPV